METRGESGEPQDYIHKL